MQKSNFNLASLVVIVVLLGLLVAVLFPAVSGSMVSSNSTAVGCRGKDIYVAITAANTEREPLGLSSLWPQSNPPTNNPIDIGQMNFTNSTDYFYALYDGANYGTEKHDPYVKGFDYSKLAGAGVPAHYLGKCRLKPENNMWTIGKNVRDTMEDIVPVLVTRNLAAESLVTDLEVVSNRHLLFDQEWKTPFGQKYIVIVRKGGGIYTIRGKYARLNILYGNQTFRTTVQGSTAPALAYLTPSKEVIPSEATYQACAAVNPRFAKSDFCYWWENTKDIFEALKVPLFFVLYASAILWIIVLLDRPLITTGPFLGPGYWVLLCLSYMFYLCCGGILMSGEGAPFILVVFVPALAFQVWGFIYLVAWEKRTENRKVYQKAFDLMLKVPFIALLAVLSLPFLYLAVGRLIRLFF